MYFIVERKKLLKVIDKFAYCDKIIILTVDDRVVIEHLQEYGYYIKHLMLHPSFFKELFCYNNKYDCFKIQMKQFNILSCLKDKYVTVKYPAKQGGLNITGETDNIHLKTENLKEERRIILIRKNIDYKNNIPKVERGLLNTSIILRKSELLKAVASFRIEDWGYIQFTLDNKSKFFVGIYAYNKKKKHKKEEVSREFVPKHIIKNNVPNTVKFPIFNFTEILKPMDNNFTLFFGTNTPGWFVNNKPEYRFGVLLPSSPNEGVEVYEDEN